MADSGVSIGEPEARAIVQLAAIPGMDGDRAAVERAMGVPFPAVQRAASGGGVSVLRSGHEQWWVLAAAERGPDLVRALEAAAAGAFAVIDLGASRSVFRLSGPMARRVLAKGSGVDFSPRAFPPGTCAATGLARLSAVIHAREDGEGFDLFVYRSFGQELKEWLEESSAAISVG